MQRAIRTAQVTVKAAGTAERALDEAQDLMNIVTKKRGAWCASARQVAPRLNGYPGGGGIRGGVGRRELPARWDEEQQEATHAEEGFDVHECLPWGVGAERGRHA